LKSGRRRRRRKRKRRRKVGLQRGRLNIITPRGTSLGREEELGVLSGVLKY